MATSPSRPWLRAGLELTGAATVLAVALAALTGSPAIEATAITLFVSALALYRLVPPAWTAEVAAQADRVPSYVACAIALAFAAGLNIALAARGAVIRSSEWPLVMEIGGLAVLAAAFAGWLYWNLRDIAGPKAPWNVLPAGFFHNAPRRAVLLILGAVCTAASIVALVTTLAAWLLQSPDSERGGAFVIALIGGAAALFSLQRLNEVLAPRAADPAQVKALTAAIGAAAQKSGAVRKVLDVQVLPASHDAVIGTVRVQFKDGTSAAHVAPVLAAMQTSAIATVPELAALVVVPPPKD